MQSPPPFVVFSSARSRSAWLANFLSYGPWSCGHEQIRYMRGLEDVKSWLDMPWSGTVETAGAGFWRTLEKISPLCRIVVVRRNPEEIFESFLAKRIDISPEDLWKRILYSDRKLSQISKRLPKSLEVSFQELDGIETCTEIFEHALQMPFDFAWWNHVKQFNIQINLQGLLKYYLANASQLNKLARQIKTITLADLSKKSFISPDSLVFREEPFDVFWKDGQDLFAEHAVAVGEDPNSPHEKNLQELKALDSIGALQILTARSNGKMLGYLMSIIGPSLEHINYKTACNTTFFASSQIPGLGRLLQKNSINLLKQKGCGEVILRAGSRGSGPKMGKLYEKIGAEEFGQLYRLDLKKD